MKAVLIIGKNIDKLIFDYTDSFVVGVDQGVMYAKKHNIKLDLAIGDFDSLEDELIDCEVVKLNPVKDITDTMAAISLVAEYNEIYILGAIQGKRIEHFIANMNLLVKYNNIIIIDDYSKIFIANNKFELTKNEYKYISLFALEDVKGLSLTGFKYNLDNYSLNLFDSLGISNEIKDNVASITYQSGKLLVIMSKEDK